MQVKAVKYLRLRELSHANFTHQSNIQSSSNAFKKEDLSLIFQFFFIFERKIHQIPPTHTQEHIH